MRLCTCPSKLSLPSSVSHALRFIYVLTCQSALLIYDLGIVSLVQVVDGPSLDRGTSTGSLGPVGWITPLIAESVINLYNAVGDGPWGEVKTVTDTAVSTEADNVAV